MEDDIVNTANGLSNCLRNLTNRELANLLSLFAHAENNAINFRRAIQDPNSDALSRTLVCLFHFIVLSNGTAARTLIEREAVQRFIAHVVTDTREQ